MKAETVGAAVGRGRGVKKKVKGEIKLQRTKGMPNCEFAMQHF